MKIFQSITKNIKFKVLVIIALSFFTSCSLQQKKSSVKSIEIYYLPPKRNYPMEFSCSPLVSGPLSSDSERQYLKITDKKFLDQFNKAFNVLQPKKDENIDVDAKIQMLVHFEEKTDTICMNSTNGIILVNNSTFENSNKLRNLIVDKISENYNPMRK